ncbi:cyanophycinase [Ferruginibacter paludis]|uniref:cyanophycinase n=1 Tax=Ferruginibacter paludis TaxID=1310417 RepID=UPI0025B3A36C|nr:cyanophycinase [Ferruginibacter paludis]MDN3654818.1 cyanophycinase [Ferruginibacter paludis]
MKYTFFLFLLICFESILLSAPAQAPQNLPAGKLFIIGGGNRSPQLMKKMLATAALGPKDYVVVLPMSASEPDTSFYYFKEDFQPVCNAPVANLNFTSDKVNDKNWLDSVKHARLIFITGGDQERFMAVVLNTPVYHAIHAAFNNGSTIAGTSAGAAVMCEKMITGKELTDTIYNATFKKIHANNIHIAKGLGLLNNAVIDQHFIVRSRYNRLLSAMASLPSYACIGIDEATAIIVEGNRITVTGESQVVLMQKPRGLQITPSGLIKMKSLQLSIYTTGDVFFINLH